MKKTWLLIFMLSILPIYCLNAQNTNTQKEEQYNNIIAERITDAIRLGDNSMSKRNLTGMVIHFFNAMALFKTLPSAEQERQLRAIYKGRDLDSLIKAFVQEIKIEVTDTIETEKNLLLKLKITHNGRPIERIDYRYPISDSYSALIKAKHGTGYIEVDPVYFKSIEKSTKPLVIECGLFDTTVTADLEGLQSYDQGINEKVYTFYKDNASRYRYTINIEAIKDISQKNTIDTINTYNPVDSTFCRINNPSRYFRVVEKLQQRSTKNNQPKKHIASFTSAGFQAFMKIINNSDWFMLNVDTLETYKFNKWLICRNHLIVINNKNKKESRIEEIAFYFNVEGKIENVKLGMNYPEKASINRNKEGNKSNVIWVLDFMDSYYTSIITKDTAFLVSLFEKPGALHISGDVPIDKDNGYNKNKKTDIESHELQDFQEWWKRFKRIIESTEEITFETYSIRLQKKHISEVYGINLFQTLSSKHYFDRSYLLFIPSSNSDNQMEIFVTTRQTRPNKDGQVYSVADFDL